MEKELIIERVDGSTIRRRYISWESFNKDKLLELRAIAQQTLDDIDAMLPEFDKV